uniref:Uncharacterized protein ORF 27 n=1 Tax=Bovine herpesvirus 4 TaxID=10385 RepID=G1EUR2_BHV4|nr:hypothetical protein [Bovine gammaherpesvirus 4]WEM32544.1 hypothetical protein [Bovine gammaherpesvirus 4]
MVYITTTASKAKDIIFYNPPVKETILSFKNFKLNKLNINNFLMACVFYLQYVGLISFYIWGMGPQMLPVVESTGGSLVQLKMICSHHTILKSKCNIFCQLDLEAQGKQLAPGSLNQSIRPRLIYSDAGVLYNTSCYDCVTKQEKGYIFHNETIVFMLKKRKINKLYMFMPNHQRLIANQRILYPCIGPHYLKYNFTGGGELTCQCNLSSVENRY